MNAGTTIARVASFVQQPQNDEALQQQRVDKAWRVVHQVGQLHQGRYPSTEVQMLQCDDVFFLAERFVACQQKFRSRTKPIQVQVAFHYTQPKNLASIRQDGLLSTLKKRHGAAFGKGIYVGTNPHAFSVYGQVGLLVLILKGSVLQKDSYGNSAGDMADSLQGNKLMTTDRRGTVFPKSSYFDEIILRKSEQVLPLVSFPKSAINNGELMFDLHQKVQHLADQLLNDGQRTFLRRVYPTLQDIRYEHKICVARQNAQPAIKTVALPNLSFQPAQIAKINQLLRAAGCALAQNTPSNPVPPGANPLFPPAKTEASDDRVECPDPMSRLQAKPKVYSPSVNPPTGECAICMNPLHNKTMRPVQLHTCGHCFHEECILKSLEMSSKCPICRNVTQEPYGTSPAGSMCIRQDKKMHCAGFERYGTLVLDYNMPSGVQSACHAHPGQRYRGTRRAAYIPNNSDGQALCKRLKYAFARGLLFNVGTSLTTNQSNVVVWASVHHKTSKSGGPHGFPDPAFFVNCNEELSALGVPKAEDCGYS